MDVSRRDRLDPEVLGEVRGARACRRVSPRSYGRWSSTKNRSRPNAAASRAAPCGSRSASPSRAQPERQTSPSFSSATVSSATAGSSRHAVLLALGSRARMRGGEDPAEVRVAAARLDEKRQVRAPPCERHLGPRDGPDAGVLRRVRELERAVDAVVVGQRERRVAELGGPRDELLGCDAPSRNEYAEWQCSST